MAVTVGSGAGWQAGTMRRQASSDATDIPPNSSEVNLMRIPPVVALAAAVVLAVAGCAEAPGDDAAAPSPTSPSGGAAQGAPAPDGGLTVGQALSSGLDGPLTVRGFLIDDGGQVRLCDLVLESYPPQCGDPSVAVQGVDVAALDGVQQAGEVRWVDQVSLTGELADGILVVSDTTS